MKNSIYKYVFLSLSACLSFVFSLVKYIQSYEIYSDEWGTDISFNLDYVIAILVSLTFLVYGIYQIIIIKKGNQSTNALAYIGLVVSSLLSFYPLGVFFKAINKQKPVADYLNYLYLGVVAFFLLISFVFSYLSLNKKSKAN